jgi:hypothetical protein
LVDRFDIDPHVTVVSSGRAFRIRWTARNR